MDKGTPRARSMNPPSKASSNSTPRSMRAQATKSTMIKVDYRDFEAVEQNVFDNVKIAVIKHRSFVKKVRTACGHSPLVFSSSCKPRT